MQMKHQHYVSAYLSHHLFCLSFPVHWGVPCITVRLVWEACYMINPYLVRKIHIATSNENNSFVC